MKEEGSYEMTHQLSIPVHLRWSSDWHRSTSKWQTKHAQKTADDTKVVESWTPNNTLVRKICAMWARLLYTRDSLRQETLVWCQSKWDAVFASAWNSSKNLCAVRFFWDDAKSSQAITTLSFHNCVFNQVSNQLLLQSRKKLLSNL